MEASAQNEGVVVEAMGLTKVFKDFWGRPKARAVNGIDFTVRQGRIFGLLGPNGSGKSTTVKLMLGLLYATRGTLKVFGESPRNVNIKRKIGYLPEESYLYRYLTAAETLDFFGALFGLVPEERRQRTEQLLEMVGLLNSRNRPVGEFSKGMARRIGLAQALINDPSLVILDEPTSGLDPIGCREVKDVIRLLSSRGKTVVICSHLLADVEDICDDVVILYGGKIRSQGDLKEVLTVEDKTRIVTPKLDAQTVERIKSVIGEAIATERIVIDHPTMNLEDFFLEVVRQAKEASIQTAGVQSGGEIAPYLRGEGAVRGEPSRRVLEVLRKQQAAMPNVEVSAEDSQAAAEPPEPRIDSAKLEKLSIPTESPEQEHRTPATPGQETEQTEQASKRLQELLQKKTTEQS